MNTGSFSKTIRTIEARLHIPLLLFLMVFTIDKISFKFIGLVLIYILNPHLNFKRNIKRIPSFYLLIVIWELLRFTLFNSDFTLEHSTSFILGCSFWTMSLLCLLQLRSITDNTSIEKLDNTIITFFWINTVVSLYNLVEAMYLSGSINPYMLSVEEYGNSTGDLIRGLFMGPSYINMMINAFFMFYFLFRDRIALTYWAAFVAALTTTNFGSLVIFLTLILCFILKNSRQIRMNIIGVMLLSASFYVFITPGNLHYLYDSLWPSQEQDKELRAAKLKSWSLDDIKTDSSELVNKYGKFKSFEQTYQFLASNPGFLLFGAGMGNFSSQLSVRMSGMNKERGSRLFHYLPSYRSPHFEENHYRIFTRTYSLPKAYHSSKHLPNSFANQLLGEYGIIGAILFIFSYVLFFLKDFGRLSFGKYLVILLGAFLLFDYLFEYLSVVVIFELLMLIDKKKLKPQNE